MSKSDNPGHSNLSRAPSDSDWSVGIDDVVRARKLIQDSIRCTEIDLSISASKQLGSEVYFKFENEQLTGSFKIRGALNKISNLSAEEKARGVVASSAGNHAQGVALSASKSGVRSTIVMPVQAPIVKVEATKGYGAEVVLHGDFYDEAYEKARELERTKGFVFVHPYQDPFVIAGQGTIGLEIMEKLPDLTSMIVPIGGGGLISGIATVVKAINPKCRVIGVQSSQASGMHSLFYGKPIHSPPKRMSTIADGIAIKTPSPFMHEKFISRLVDEIVLVSDEEIAEAIVFLIERAKSVAEGSGAAGLAALLSRKLDIGSKCCVVLCGGNIDLNLVSKVIERGQIRRGRLAEISVVVDDLPGNLSRLTSTIANLRANVVEVRHDRVRSELFLRETRIDFVVETRSHEHVQEIRSALKAEGARLVEN